MEVVVASHPAARRHDTGPRHPERSQRVDAVVDGIQSSGLTVDHIESPSAGMTELALVHDPSYVEMIERFCRQGGGALDMDTYVSSDSWEAALTAAGGVGAVIEELATHSDATGFAVSRPPGHHATRNRAMGFCLFNNVAIAAAVLRSRRQRVAILDWDVHHGNGTQDVLLDDPGTLYVSLHQDHFYPYAGEIDDIETGEAKGTIVNIPLPAGTTGDVYREAWDGLVIPVVAQFEPDWVLISAGFDAHASDELADLYVQSADYGYLTGRLRAIHPPNRTVLALEGGYDLTALHDSVAAALLGLRGEFSEVEPVFQSPEASKRALSSAAEAIGRHWRI